MSEKLINIAKFIFFFLICPVIVTSTWSLNLQLKNLGEDLNGFFVLGLSLYLVIHLFIMNPSRIFRFGQKGISYIFRFFPKAENIVSLVLPVYVFLIWLVYFINSMTVNLFIDERYLVSAIGFALAMHVVQTAEGLRGAEGGGEAHYYFTFGLAYVANIMVVSLLLSISYPQFSFAEFFNVMGTKAGSFYSLIFDTLFAAEG